MPKGYARILVPVDFSAGSKRALREARKLLRDGGQLLLLHVTRHLDPALPWSPTNRRIVDKLQRQAVDEARERLDAEAEALGDLKVRTRVVEGIPHEKILSEAKRAKSEVIVMGSQGHTLSERLLVGSTSERVVRKSTVPVLVAPRARR